MKRIIFLVIAVSILWALRAQDLHHYTLPPTDTINHSSITTHTLTPKLLNSSTSKLSFSQWLSDKLLRENFLIVDKPAYTFTLDPLFNNYLGREFESGRNIWGNTRGVRIQGEIDKKLSFSTSYLETQSVFAPYLDSIVRTLRVVPGQLYMGQRGKGLEHSHAFGWLRYQPNRIFSFEAGHGKNFFGNGYRSMLLSDAAANYPYFRIDTRIWRIHYVNLWAEFQDINFRDNYEDGWQKKYGAFHYLSLAITNRLELSAFEAIHWQGRDSTHHRGFDINYLNPIIMFRPVEWTLGSPDNALMGGGLSYRFGNSTYLYGQLLLDELKVSEIKNWSNGWWANKVAWQLGAKTWIPIGERGTENRYVFLQSEFNAARPYTYSHVTSKQNHGHFNQSLAHPLGANFWEWVNFARLRWDCLILEGRYSLARFGSDFNGSNYGHNIFLPYGTHESDYDVFIGNGLLNTLTYKMLTASYLVNPASNFNIFLKLTDRHQVTELKDKHDLMFQFGVRSSVQNFYYDF